MGPEKIARLLPDFCQTYFLLNSQWHSVVTIISVKFNKRFYLTLSFYECTVGLCAGWCSGALSPPKKSKIIQNVTVIRVTPNIQSWKFDAVHSW